MSGSENPTQFTKVDQTSDPRFFIEFLDARKTVEGEREVKELILDLLRLKPGANVLDIGCGTGDDAREIAGRVGPTGRVVGIDLSEFLVNESKRRAEGLGLPVEFLRGDARRLDFPDASFDCVRTDRVLMFVPEVETALSEVVRVLRPGGRIVSSELDFEMQYLDGHFPDVTRKVFAAFAANNPQPCLGRQLRRLLAEQGLQNLKSVARVLRTPYKLFRRAFDGLLASAVQRGQLTEAEVNRWLEDAASSERAGLFNNGVVVFTAAGEKP
jgi:ubiquinone/menaquinone biosynthesis C-methylase UbiE